MSCSNPSGGGSGSGGPWTGPGGNGVSTQIGFTCQEYLPGYPDDESIFSIIQTTDGVTWTLRGEMPIPTGDEGTENIAYGNTKCVGGKEDGSLLLVIGNYWFWYRGFGFGQPISIVAAKYAVSTATGTNFTVRDFPVNLIEYVNPDDPLGWHPLLTQYIPNRYVTPSMNYYPWWYQGIHDAFDLQAIVEFDGKILVSTLCYNTIYSTVDGLTWEIFYRDYNAYDGRVWDPADTRYRGGRTWGFQRMIRGPNGIVALLGIDGPYYLLPGDTAPTKATLTGADVSAIAHSYNSNGYLVGYVWQDLQHVNGRWIAFGTPWNLTENVETFHIAVSTDAVNWNVIETTAPPGYTVANTANYPNPTIAYCGGYYFLAGYVGSIAYGTQLIRSTDLVSWSVAPASEQHGRMGWGFGSVNGTMVTTTVPQEWGYEGGGYVQIPPHPIDSPTRLAYTTSANLDWQVATLNAPNAIVTSDGSRQWSAFGVFGASVAAAGDGFPSAPTEPDCNGCSWIGKERQYRPSRSVTQARTKFIQGPHPVFSRGKKSFFDEV